MWTIQFYLAIVLENNLDRNISNFNLISYQTTKLGSKEALCKIVKSQYLHLRWGIFKRTFILWMYLEILGKSFGHKDTKVEKKNTLDTVHVPS